MNRMSKELSTLMNLHILGILVEIYGYHDIITLKNAILSQDESKLIFYSYHLIPNLHAGVQEMLRYIAFRELNIWGNIGDSIWCSMAFHPDFWAALQTTKESFITDFLSTLSELDKVLLDAESLNL